MNEDFHDLQSAAFLGMREAVMVTDLSGIILDVNPAFERMYGYPCSEVIGQTPTILKSDRHADPFFQQIWHTLRRGMVWEGNIFNRRKDESNILVEECISTLFDKTGQPEFYLAVMRELAMTGWESKKGHKAPHRHETMAAGLAHDFNNLVAPLLAYAEMAVVKIGNGEVPENEIQQILLAGTRAKELAQQVLTFCRQDTTKMEVVFLDSIIKDVVSLLEISRSPDVEIKINACESGGIIMGEPIQMHQVLMNLATNAAHAMPEGGTLTIELDPVSITTNSPYIGDLKLGHYVRLSVKDTGHGMDEETKRQAFDPFFSSKTKKEGAGLGLSIVQNIIRDHGGEVYLKSKVGEGTTVDVILPRRENYDLSDTQKIPIQEMPVGQGTILLVDDEQAIVQMGKNMLEYIGYNVIGLTGSQQALERFRTRPYDFDLIITDEIMPGLKGHEFAREARDIRDDIPIIFISGFIHRIPPNEQKALGNCETLQKPFSSQNLMDAVTKLLPPDSQ